jgi:hypothetical protein
MDSTGWRTLAEVVAVAACQGPASAQAITYVEVCSASCPLLEMGTSGALKHTLLKFNWSGGNEGRKSEREESNDLHFRFRTWIGTQVEC